MIPPRGCAYICMVHRQDAYRARQKLSTGSFKIGSKVIKVEKTLLNSCTGIITVDTNKDENTP